MARLLDVAPGLARVSRTSGSCCIYVIYNNANGKGYIGQSINASRRKLQHLRKLKLGSHYNQHLQNAWNKYGVGSFVFLVIEECNDAADMSIKEAAYIKDFNTRDWHCGYNIAAGDTRVCRGGLHYNYGKHLSAETKRRISLSRAGQGSGSNNVNYGRSLSAKTRKKISNARKGKYCGKANHFWGVDRSGSNHPMFGIRLSEEHKKRLRGARPNASGSKNHRARAIDMLGEDGRVLMSFDTLTEAGEYMISIGKTQSRGAWSNIQCAASGKTKHAYGFRWEYGDSKYGN